MTKRHVVLRTLKPKPRRPKQKPFQKKMSIRQGPPKHQNKFAWIPNVYNKQSISLSVENILLRKTISYL